MNETVTITFTIPLDVHEAVLAGSDTILNNTTESAYVLMWLLMFYFIIKYSFLLLNYILAALKYLLAFTLRMLRII